ncbi:metallophosphoesterase [Sphingobacterium thalpophilum]|uniref:metallophosphoesterase n=1 Tax=Sphingobacterium thalpophilum TaxID=259 RepID=UPI003D9839FB
MARERVFVMGDIHGAYRALMQCLERSEFDYEMDTLIQLGDVVDGYGQSYECVEELLKIKNLIAIRGNHDAWFYDFSQTDFHPGYWNYGGKATIESYLEHAGKKLICIPSGSGYKTSLNSSDIPAAHRQFFQNQKIYFIDEQQRCFVHGGFNREIAFDQQAFSKYYWDRDLWTDALIHENAGGTVKDFQVPTPFKEIFIGHTSTTNWETDKPMTALNITNLDTGAGHTGKLTIMDVNSKQYWQSEPVVRLYN